MIYTQALPQLKALNHLLFSLLPNFVFLEYQNGTKVFFKYKK